MRIFKENAQERILGSILESERAEEKTLKESETYTKQKQAKSAYGEGPTETPSKLQKLGDTKETGKELGKCYKHQDSPDKEYGEEPKAEALPKKTAKKLGEEVSVTATDGTNQATVVAGDEVSVETTEEPIVEPVEEPTVEESQDIQESSARPNEELLWKALEGGSMSTDFLLNELLSWLSDDELGEFIKNSADIEERISIVTTGVEESCGDKDTVEEDEELARKAFVSLQKLDDGSYVILKDGEFQEKISATSDEEAIKKFKEKYSNAKECSNN